MPCDQFHRDRSTRDGLRAWCKSCVAAWHRGDLAPAVRWFTEIVDDAWRADAACRGCTDVMFGSDVAAAQAVCGTCAVSARCLDVAIANREQFGVWGGVLFYPGKAKRFERERAQAVAS
jgi:hypothetical protein